MRQNRLGEMGQYLRPLVLPIASTITVRLQTLQSPQRYPALPRAALDPIHPRHHRAASNERSSQCLAGNVHSEGTPRGRFHEHDEVLGSRAFAGACLWICGPKRGRCKAPRTGLGTTSAHGFKRTLWGRASNVCFAPNSGHKWLGRGMSAFDP